MKGKPPGSLGTNAAPPHVRDGTSTRTASPRPGILDVSSWVLVDYKRRVGYVEDAWARAATRYAYGAVVKHVGEDCAALLGGIAVGLLMALGVVVVTTLTGGAIGGAAGALAGGVGAVPGAVAGADFGLAVGNFILAWLGIAFLAVYIGSHLAGVVDQLRLGTVQAWNSGGSPAAIDRAARELADATGIVFSLVLQAIVVYITKAANKGGTQSALTELRESLIFKRCKAFEPWLIKNYPRLRAKYFKLHWEVLAEGPPIIKPGQTVPNTSIPEWTRIKVGERVFEVIRNKDALVKDRKTGLPRVDPKTKLPTGETVGPAMKHLDERATTAGDNWPKSEWAKMSKVDFPMSSLAGALDQAEAQLIFQPPASAAKPVKLDNWELLIDTTKTPWRVWHAEYTPHPKW